MVRRNASDLGVLWEIFGARVYDFPYEAAGPVRTIVDAGAHIGLAGVYLSQRFPGARIVSIEAASDNVAVLRENARLRGSDWRIMPAALDVRRGPRTLYRSQWWSSGTVRDDVATARDGDRSRFEAKWRLAPEQVPGVLLEDVVTAVGERVDLLKLDIEGAEEALVLEGDAAAWHAVQMLVIEVHDKYINGDRVRRGLDNLGLLLVERRGDVELRRRVP